MSLACEYHKDCSEQALARIDIPHNWMERGGYGLGVATCRQGLIEVIDIQRIQPVTMLVTFLKTPILTNIIKEEQVGNTTDQDK